MVAPSVSTPRFSKPEPARQCEARARAKALGVRIAVVSEARSYVSNSQTTPGLTYRIERSRQGWGCECDGYLFTGMCKHIGAVERRSEREGWKFGTVAPVATQIAPPAPAAVIPFPQRDPAAAAARRQMIDSELYG